MSLVVEIEKMGHRGMGIARYRGKVIFVPFTAPGDHAEVNVIRTRRDYDEAELIRLLHPSPFRIDPTCPAFGQCGGCHLQHLSSSYQRSFKENLFREMLIHHGDVAENRIKRMLNTPRELQYRSRIEAHVLWNNKPVLGFMARGKNNLMPVDNCLLALPSIQPFLGEVPRWLEKTRARGITKVDIACNDSDDKVSLILCSQRRPPTPVCKSLSNLASEIPHLRGLYMVQRESDTFLPLWKRESDSAGISYAVPIDDSRQEIILEAWPTVFRQVNPFVNRRLISTALSWIQKCSPKRILDLYAGMGNFTLPLSFLTREVVAVEINPMAVENAKANAVRNNRRNIHWINSSVKNALKLLVDSRKSFDLVILDPPRSGARESLEEILALSPERIMYISCEPATLARDLHFLQKNGDYHVERTQPLDMFPQTFHIESITLLTKVR